MPKSYLIAWDTQYLDGTEGPGVGGVFSSWLKTCTLPAGFKNGKLIVKYYGSSCNSLDQSFFISQLFISLLSQILTALKNLRNLLNWYAQSTAMFGFWGILITRSSHGTTVHLSSCPIVRMSASTKTSQNSASLTLHKL